MLNDKTIFLRTIFLILCLPLRDINLWNGVKVLYIWTVIKKERY